MDWGELVIDYCERRSGAFWAEPLNAATNGAFLLAAAAAFALWRSQPRRDLPALALIVVTAAVGLGSFVFHTVATKGAMVLDVLPITIFIYGYLFLALRRFFGLGAAASGGALAAFAAGSYVVGETVHGLNGSVAYLPALAALAVTGLLLRADETPERRAAGQSLLAAAGAFVASLVFRTIDRDVCVSLPQGTHFLWHLLNAAVLWLLLRSAILWDGPQRSGDAEPEGEGAHGGV